jgi:hypothetical protein
VKALLDCEEAEAMRLKPHAIDVRFCGPVAPAGIKTKAKIQPLKCVVKTDNIL